MTTTRINKKDYRDYPGVNNSSWDYLLPECGGSPKRFHAYMNGLMEKSETPAMELGSLIHEYLENPAKFSYSSFGGEEPTAKLKEVIDMVIDIVPPHVTDINAAKDAVLEIAEKVDYGGTWKPETILKNVLKFEHYYSYAKGLPEDCHRLDTATANKLGMIISNLEMDNAWYKDVEAKYGKGWQLETEVPLVGTKDGVEYKCLIDRLLINHDMGVFGVEEIKSISMPIVTYVGGWEYTDYQTLTSSTAVGAYLHRNVHRQLAFYTKMAAGFLPGYSHGAPGIHVIETTFPYEYHHYNLPSRYMEIGQKTVEDAMWRTTKAMEHMII